MSPADRSPQAAWGRSGAFAVLSADAQRDLCVRAQAGDRAARDRLVASSMGFVFAQARKHVGRSGSLDFDDLVSEGAFGLLDGIAKFDPSQNVRFITYAAWWVRHHIQRAVENGARTIRAPVHAQTTAAKIRRASRRLAVRGNLAPSEEDLAEATGLPIARVRAARDVGPEPKSLDAEMPNATGDGPSLHDFIPSDELWIDDRLARAELRARIREKCDALAPSLDERERAILNERLLAERGEEMILADIGARFDLCRERVRQLEAGLVQRLRAVLRPEWDEYQGLARRGTKRAPSVLKATVREIAAATTLTLTRADATPAQKKIGNPRGEYIATVAHHLSVFGWPKSALRRHAELIAQAFEWEMEPVQCAMQINKRESEGSRRRTA